MNNFLLTQITIEVPKRKRYKSSTLHKEKQVNSVRLVRCTITPLITTSRAATEAIIVPRNDIYIIKPFKKRVSEIFALFRL